MAKMKRTSISEVRRLLRCAIQRCQDSADIWNGANIGDFEMRTKALAKKEAFEDVLDALEFSDANLRITAGEA